MAALAMIVAVHDRELNVHEDQVWPIFRHGRKCLLAVLCFSHFVIVGRQQIAHDLTIVRSSGRSISVTARIRSPRRVFFTPFDCAQVSASQGHSGFNRSRPNGRKARSCTDSCYARPVTRQCAQPAPPPYGRVIISRPWPSGSGNRTTCRRRSHCRRYLARTALPGISGRLASLSTSRHGRLVDSKCTPPTAAVQDFFCSGWLWHRRSYTRAPGWSEWD